jgi:hypothetical protein
MTRKTDQTRNGDLCKRQREIVPKGMKLIHVPELRAYIMIRKRATEDQCREKIRKYLARYHDDLDNSMKHNMKRSDV